MRQRTHFSLFLPFPFPFSMKIPFLSLGLSLVLLTTTFCSRDYSDPTPTTARATGKDAIQPYPYPQTPIGFNPQTCSVDPNGINTVLYQEARNNAYYTNGSQISDAEFASLQATAAATPSPSIDGNGHVSGTPYADRVNSFSDGVKAQMDEYNYYVYYASLHGADVQNEEDVKAIVEEQFELTIPVQPGESLSATAQDEISMLTNATRPQLAHTFQLFSSAYRCEGVYSRGTKAEGQTGKVDMTFKEFRALRKAGKIGDMSGTVAQRGFWSFLKKAVHIVVSVAVYTVIGAFTDGPKFQKASCGTPPPASCTTAAYFLAGAAGFVNGIIKVANNNCIFGGC
jgi:hypothetical protein